MKKLVRDKIPAIIAKTGKMPDFYVALREEYEQELFKKLVEELEEFKENPCIEEAADIYEVFLAILDHWNMVPLDVASYGNKKRYEKGGFRQRFILNLRRLEEEDEDEPTEDWDVNAHGEQR
tara:strand:- start:196 stop:561 length:366 start_codon:yes stop_codon:yes gene_type:complete